ncbi:MAG: radical SAM protein [Nitrospinae bacterium]|nr:radical SAM protein [Nitrospinota bacterium]
MKHKIVLIHPYLSLSNINFLSEPLGLAYISAVLKKEDYDVKVLDCFAENFSGTIGENDGAKRRGLSDEAIIQKIKEYQPGFIGIQSNFTELYIDSLNIAKLIKKTFPEKKIILGGSHATFDHAEIIKEESIDYIVRGEGEVTVVELINSLTGRTKTALSDIDGITFRKVGKVQVNKNREFIKDLDTLPLPDYKSLRMDVYLQNAHKVFGYSMSSPVAAMVTSRGCPYDCIFCSTKNMWERRWRSHSPERVVEQIKLLVNDYQVKEIAINDDSFLVNLKRVEKICDLIIQENIKVNLIFPPGLTVWTLSNNIIDKLIKAGLYKIYLPIETGCKKTLEFIKKPVDLDKTRDTINYLNAQGVFTHAYFIIGFPFETKEDIQETLDYAYSSNVDYIDFYIAQPVKGSEMYDIYKQEGILDKVENYSNVYGSKYNTVNFTAEEMNSIRDNAQRNYMKTVLKRACNPLFFLKYILPKILSLRNLLYLSKNMFGIVLPVILPKKL